MNEINGDRWPRRIRCLLHCMRHMIAHITMRANALKIAAVVCCASFAGSVGAEYRYLILDAPVDQPQPIDPETLQPEGQGITYTAPEAAVVPAPEPDAMGAHGNTAAAPWILDAPPAEPQPGPTPSDDPYAPRFEHNLPWPTVLDERPAGPQSVQPPPVAMHEQAPETHYQLPPPPLPSGPQVLEFGDQSMNMPAEEPPPPRLPKSSALDYPAPAAPVTRAAPPELADRLSVVVDRQLRGTAPLRLAANGVPMLSIQTLEALRLPVPASALERGFATPDDLSQSYAHAFDAAGQLLVLTSLAPPKFSSAGDTETWAPAAPQSRPRPAPAPLAAPEPDTKSRECAPQMRRGRNTRDC